MIAADDVRAMLRATDVLDNYGASYRDTPQIRLAVCPRCGERSRQAVVVDRARGEWIHHGHGAHQGGICSGDILELLAAFEGLDCKRDLRRVIGIGAAIAGLTASLDGTERTRIREQHAREQQEYERARAAKRAEERAAAPGLWNGLARRSDIGERYLADRGLDAHELATRGIVRFTSDGWPTLPLRDLATGAIVALQSRIVDGPRKIHNHGASNGSALVGRLADLDANGVDVAVIVEGLADTLAAHLAFPGRAIFGAAGADRIVEIAAWVAPRVRACRGWLLIAIDNDDPGVAAAAAGVRAAREAGLVLDRDLHLLELGAHHDLADAYAAGWRWTWPLTARTA